MLNEKIARGVGPQGVDLAYERLGHPADPPVLLIMGLAAQMVNWPDGFLDALLSRGLQPIRFDNRDCGHSTHMSAAPPPDFPAALGGDFASASYTLSEMAADAAGLLDHLGLPAAHLLGASMGGVIAQTLAIEQPSRVLSLTSMMSTTGDPAVGQIDPETQKALFGGPPATTREAVVERALRTAPLVRSPSYLTPPEEIAARAGLAFDRGHDLVAVARQAIASLASGDRTARLRELRVPALVIHGTADRICDASGGRATAAAIPGAELLLLEGLGHDLPQELWEPIADAVANLVRRAERR